MFIFDLLAGFITATLAGLGIGGGGLLVIYLSLVRHMPQLQAQGINLVFFLLASSAALIIHIKKKRINWKRWAGAALFGAIGALAGCWTALRLDPNFIRKIFGALLVVSGIIELFRKSPSNDK